ncbi:MAG: CotH kinase family protein [Bacteroidota bacterium]
MKKLFLGIIFLSSASFISFSQNPGDATFFSPDIHIMKIYFSQINWWDSLVMYKPLDKKMLGDVDIDGTYVDSVGIQFKGNSSFSKDSLKNSFKIDFNEFVSGQKYDGLKVINLNNGASDPTMMREKIFLDFCSEVVIEAPRATYTNLYINDTLWGFYTLVEQVNKTFLENEYGNDGGNLFKGDPSGTLEWFGNNPANYYNSYELKTNETENDWTDLVHLIDEINNTPSANFYDSIEVVLNSTAWIEGWAANNIFVTLDSYMGSGHNYYVYHNTETDKFDFIIWDVNGTFGGNKQMVSPIENLSILFIPPSPLIRPLNKKMLQDNTYKNNYVNTVCNYASNYFSHAYFDPIIDSLANLIRPYIYADTNYLYTNQQFEDNINIDVITGTDTIPGLKSFITKRRNSLASQLAAEGCFLGVNDIGNEPVFEFFPNPCSDVVCVRSEFQDLQLRIFDMLGNVVYKKTLNFKHETLNLNLPNGLYFLQVYNNSSFQTQMMEVIK